MTFPLQLCADVGANVTVTSCAPPGGMVPLVKVAVYEPAHGAVRLVIVNVVFPLFVIVKVACALWPTATLPNDRFPLNEMILVGVTPLARTPVPDTAMVLVPPVWSPFTVKVPL